jgi:hypothetical protein
MAIAAKRDGLNDWSLTITSGQRPLTYIGAYDFYVEGTGPVPSAGIAERRSWRESLRRSMECPIGQAMCPTGVQGRSECRDVTNDIYCKSPSLTTHKRAMADMYQLAVHAQEHPRSTTAQRLKVPRMSNAAQELATVRLSSLCIHHPVAYTSSLSAPSSPLRT